MAFDMNVCMSSMKDMMGAIASADSGSDEMIAPTFERALVNISERSLRSGNTSKPVNSRFI